MEGPSRDASSPPLLAGVVEVRPDADCTCLAGDCPTCGARLSIALEADGSHGTAVACLRCRGLYRVKNDTPHRSRHAEAFGFGVSYAVEGTWDPPALLEHLFDNVGAVEYVAGGFICHPDDGAAGLPTIMVDEGSRIIRFAICGNYSENEAAAIVTQAASELGAGFQVDLRPLALDRWEYRDEAAGLALVERRPLGIFLRGQTRHRAHA
jgi:hypothetical protein